MNDRSRIENSALLTSKAESLERAITVATQGMWQCVEAIESMQRRVLPTSVAPASRVSALVGELRSMHPAAADAFGRLEHSVSLLALTIQVRFAVDGDHGL